MNFKIILFFILILFITQENVIAQDSGNYALIRYVNPATTTIFDISCESFDSAFDDMKELNVKIHSHEIHYIDSCFNFFKEDKELKNIDVRAKIIYKRNGKSIIICMGNTGIFYRQDIHKFMRNELLRKFIFKKMNYESWK